MSRTSRCWERRNAAKVRSERTAHVFASSPFAVDADSEATRCSTVRRERLGLTEDAQEPAVARVPAADPASLLPPLRGAELGEPRVRTVPRRLHGAVVGLGGRGAGGRDRGDGEEDEQGESSAHGAAP